MENKNIFEMFENNNFVYFSRPGPITTYAKDGKEIKKLPFPKDFSWKIINKDNYNEFFNCDDKSFYIITGEMSNITVIDFDKVELYEQLIEDIPELKNHFTVKTKKGYHIYFKYNESLPNTTNINKLVGIDCRNDGGIVIAPPTKYKLLNGDKAKYKYLGGTIQDIPAQLFRKVITK